MNKCITKKNMWRGKLVSVSAGHSKSDATAFARMVSVLLQGGVSAGAVSVFCRVVSVVLQRQVRVMSVFFQGCASAFAGWCQYFCGVVIVVSVHLQVSGVSFCFC